MRGRGRPMHGERPSTNRNISDNANINYMINGMMSMTNCWYRQSTSVHRVLEFYLFDRQLHNIGEIISKKMCEIILSGDSHKGTNWPLA